MDCVCPPLDKLWPFMCLSALFFVDSCLESLTVAFLVVPTFCTFVFVFFGSQGVLSSVRQRWVRCYGVAAYADTCDPCVLSDVDSDPVPCSGA